jgi:hypothetical protein
MLPITIHTPKGMKTTINIHNSSTAKWRFFFADLRLIYLTPLPKLLLISHSIRRYSFPDFKAHGLPTAIAIFFSDPALTMVSIFFLN